MATATAQIPSRTAPGDALQRRLSALKKNYERDRSDVAVDLGKLSKTHPPSMLAFGVVGIMAVTIDILNFVLDVTVVADFFLSVLFFLCIRSLINRSVGMQWFLGGLMLAGLAVSVVIPVFGSLVGGPMLLVVCAFGIMNPGVKVHKVDKEKIQGAIKKFSKTLAVARQNTARLLKFGRRTRGLRTLTTKIARSKTFKAFSGNSKTTRRLLISAAAESIDFIAWIPFNTVNAFLTYSDLRKAHAEAQSLLEEYSQQEQNALSIEMDLAREQYQGEISESAPPENVVPIRPRAPVMDVARPGNPASQVARPVAPAPQPLAVPMRDVALAA